VKSASAERPDRLKEAAKHGFKTAIIPHGNATKKTMDV